MLHVLVHALELAELLGDALRAKVLAQVIVDVHRVFLGLRHNLGRLAAAVLACGPHESGEDSCSRQSSRLDGAC